MKANENLAEISPPASEGARRHRLIVCAEYFLWLLGATCLGMYFTVRFQQQAFAQARLQELLLASSQWIEPNTFDELSRQSVADSDRTLWCFGFPGNPISVRLHA